jgi:hypothetical protein
MQFAIPMNNVSPKEETVKRGRNSPRVDPDAALVRQSAALTDDGRLGESPKPLPKEISPQRSGVDDEYVCWSSR